MSDRQDKIQRKARKRRHRLLEYASALTVPEGYKLVAGFEDFEHRITVAVQHNASLYRNAVSVLVGGRCKFHHPREFGLEFSVLRIVVKMKLSKYISDELDRQVFESLAGIAPGSATA